MPRFIVFEDVNDPYPHEVHAVKDVDEATEKLHTLLSNTATDEYKEAVMAMWETNVHKNIVTSPKNQSRERYVYVEQD